MSTQVGILNLNGQPVSDDQAAMIQASLKIADHSEPKVWRSVNVLLGCAELAVGRNTTSVQPYVTPAASITFDGRLDNRGDLRLLLQDVLQGESSDPALALMAYQRHKSEGLANLIGDWSLTIWDQEREELVLASDFAGVRPLYYSIDSTRIIWSTQLKLLLRLAPHGGIDEQFVAGFLQAGGCPGRTPYRGIYSLRPGHFLMASSRTIRLCPFWRLPVDCSIRYSRESDYEERLRELLRDAVRSRLSADAPVLSELSGGIDSSSIVCMARHLVSSGDANPPRLLTISYERDGSLDKRFYSAVERACGFESVHLSTDDYRFLTENDCGDALPDFWDQLHTGVAGVIRRIGARTLLTGSLGDLILGNWWDDSSQIAGLIRKGAMGSALRQSLAWSKALRIPIGAILWKSLLSSLPAALVKSRSTLYSDGPDGPGLKEDSLTSTFQRSAGIDQGYDLFSTDWMEARPERRKHFRALMETLELRKLQPPEPLVHVECTHPYAHRPLVCYMLSIPPEIVCRPGEPRRLMRRAFRPFWPPELQLRRSKDAFGGVFLDALRPIACKLAVDVKRLQVVERGYVDPKLLGERLGRLAHSLECNAAQLRHIILLELWLRRANL